jgi:Bacterial antitoxin of type II TA system, VapB
MKTTIDIADALLEEARVVAQGRSTSLKALVEEGLREVVARSAKSQAVPLRDASVAGGWFQPEFAGASWERLAEAAYDGRGT